ncbi:MFS transporter M2 [Paramyrothecium foliicola]|nr:MFS transporter M2 [Paramyrothecium foliicola]
MTDAIQQSKASRFSLLITLLAFLSCGSALALPRGTTAEPQCTTTTQELAIDHTATDYDAFISSLNAVFGEEAERTGIQVPIHTTALDFPGLGHITAYGSYNSEALECAGYKVIITKRSIIGPCSAGLPPPSTGSDCSPHTDHWHCGELPIKTEISSEEPSPSPSPTASRCTTHGDHFTRTVDPPDELALPEFTTTSRIGDRSKCSLTAELTSTEEKPLPSEMIPPPSFTGPGCSGYGNVWQCDDDAVPSSNTEHNKECTHCPPGSSSATVTYGNIRATETPTNRTTTSAFIGTEKGRQAAVHQAEAALHNQYNLLPRPKLVVCFFTLSITLLIAFLDQNGIGITLPTIATEFNAADSISWAGTTSLIANTTFQMLYGRLSDIFGRKSVYLCAIACLSLADLLCGLSTGSAMFYICRGLAGIGSGGIINLSLIILSDVVTLEQRGKYMGILAAVMGVGNVLGPFLAAAFVQQSTWRAFFYLLAPLGAVSGAVAYFYLPGNPPTLEFRESIKKIDYLGTFTLSLGIIFLLIPISGGGAYFAWSSPMVISMLIIGALSLILFVVVEWKVAKLPVMPVTIFANIAVIMTLLQTFLFGAVHQASIYFIPLYLLNVRQLSQLHSAGIIAGLVLSQSLASILSGLYISRFKRYGELIIFGFSFWLLGVGLLLTYNRASSPGQIVGPLMAVGCAGGAVGLAATAAVMQATLRKSLPVEWQALANNTYALPSDFGDRPGVEGVYEAYMMASRAAFIMWLPMIEEKEKTPETAQVEVLNTEAGTVGHVESGEKKRKTSR